MKNVNRLKLIACYFFLLIVIPHRVVAERICIDTGWKFYLGDAGESASSKDYDDSSWRRLDLPHDWSIEGMYDRTENGTDWQSGFLPAGIGWYRKSFAYLPEWKEQKVQILFDGIYLNSEVWINGHLLGKRPNGYIGFMYDLTPFLEEGMNYIAVKVDQSKPLTGRWYTGSGIYRHVYLSISGKTYIPYSGVCFNVETLSEARADVLVEVEIAGEQEESLRVVTSLVNNRQEVVARKSLLYPFISDTVCSLTMSVHEPERWSPDNPVTYMLLCQLYRDGKLLDENRQLVGFRSLEFSAETGFHLNGKNIKLKGVCEHHTAGAVGAAVPDDLLYFRLKMLKEMGCNAIRTAHNPFAPEFYSMCDTLGIMVLNEGLDGWGISKARDDYGNYFKEWWLKDMTDFIRRDRNHPSVIMWSIGNEVTGATMEVQRDLITLFHTLDSSRPVTQGGTDPTRGMLTDYSKNFSGIDIVGFNGNGEEVGEFESFRKKFPNRCAVATEVPHTYQTRGVYRSKTQWRRRDFPAPWERKDGRSWESFKDRVFPISDLTEEECFPEENAFPYYQSSYDNASVRIGARASWRRICSFPWLMGSFRWGSFDYLGEAEWPQRCGNFGIIDVAGIPKDAYFLYQSLWSDKPMVHMLPHWTHLGKEGERIPVVIYTNCDSVELFLNDVSLGSQIYEGEQLVWLVPYIPGKIEARAMKDGKEIAIDRCQTASLPYTTAFSCNKKMVKAASNEVIRIVIDVVDQAGVTCPYASEVLTFEWNGPVRLLGVDNGDPVDKFPYKRPLCRTFRGKCVLLLQPTGEAGNIEITVKSENLKENNLIIQAL